MFQFLQPVLAAIIGAAMSVFGLLHSTRLFPSATVWHKVAAATPQLGIVLLFAACALLSAAGVVMFVSGVRETRRRVDQIRRASWQTDPATPSRLDESDDTRWG